MPKPSTCIPVSEAEKLQKKWMDTRAKDIERAQQREEVCAVTFNIDQLQEYINYVKEESANQEIASPAIRVYFAAYDDATSNKATVFLCAAEGVDGNSKTNYNIEPLNKGNGGWPPKAYRSGTN
jgi:hypothetical protein